MSTQTIPAGATPAMSVSTGGAYSENAPRPWYKNPMYIGAGVGSLLVLFLVYWFFIRGRGGDVATEEMMGGMADFGGFQVGADF